MEEKKRIRRKIVHEWPPIGTKLKGKIRGEEIFAVVVRNEKTASGKALKYNNIIYTSMTAAANAATGNSIDGWMFWKVIEPKKHD